MAGRRLRQAVQDSLLTNENGGFGKDIHVVIAGLTNSYSQYVTTYEEYQMQRYEGGSTLYGPHTLSAYIQEFKKLATAMANGEEVDAGPLPPDLLDKQISLLPPVVVDMTPPGVKFGDVKQDVPQNASYKKEDIVEVTFWSSNPRNDLMTEGTFSLVELLEASGNWSSAYDDDDFCLRFKWSRPASLSPYSHATIQWEIPQATTPGIYRIRHFNAARSVLGSIQYFTGASSAFFVS
eukprot:Gb_04890 [translate_table: standard]